MRLPVAILAGGLATHLRPLTDDIPKALVEVAGKPFVEHQLQLLQRHGCRRVVLCVGYRGKMIQTALGDGSRWGLRLDYAFDGEKLLGTGGALRKAALLLGESFLLLYGDSYLDFDYAAVEDAFLKSGKKGLMTVFRNANRWVQSNVIFRNGRILRYDKGRFSPEMEHVDYGFGALQTNVFDVYPPDTVINLTTVYQGLLVQDALAGFEVTRRFYEIGSKNGLEETRRFLLHYERTK